MHRASVHASGFHVLSPIPDQGPAVSPPTTAKMTPIERIDRTTATATIRKDTLQYDRVLHDDVMPMRTRRFSFYRGVVRDVVCVTEKK
jgi:hypothetical protein